jgi:hypothetical protein
MKPLFGERYIGLFEWRSPADAPVLKERQVAILNRSVHWSAIYRKNGKNYEFDSYGRDLLGSGFADAKMPTSFRQTFSTADCGQRSIAWLIKVL